MEIAFDKIDDNPFRDLARNPIRAEHLARLVESVAKTGFWDNVLVRPHPQKRGRYQLAYGHARLEAAKQSDHTKAEFAVRDLTDAEMIQIMASENVTQFGKDSFATYQEATIAAATLIMSEVLANPKAAQNFLRRIENSPEHATRLASDIISGGCPGERVVAAFFNGDQDDDARHEVLNVADIRLALQTFRETGELAAWHAANNPNATKSRGKTVDPSAIARFQSSHHVRAFVEQVIAEKVPVKAQAKLADHVVNTLRDHQRRKAAAKPRRSYDSTVPEHERLTSTNIRKEVSRAVHYGTQTQAEKDRAEQIDRMTSIEKRLHTIETGLQKTTSGFRGLREIMEAIGALADSDLSPLATESLHKIKGYLIEMQQLMADCGSQLQRTGAETWITH